LVFGFTSSLGSNDNDSQYRLGRALSSNSPLFFSPILPRRTRTMASRPACVPCAFRKLHSRWHGIVSCATGVHERRIHDEASAVTCAPVQLARESECTESDPAAAVDRVEPQSRTRARLRSIGRQIFAWMYRLFSSILLGAREAGHMRFRSENPLGGTRGLVLADRYRYDAKRLATGAIARVVNHAIIRRRLFG
jgi:hypothetical protein